MLGGQRWNLVSNGGSADRGQIRDMVRPWPQRLYVFWQGQFNKRRQISKDTSLSHIADDNNQSHNFLYVQLNIRYINIDTAGIQMCGFGHVTIVQAYFSV